VTNKPAGNVGVGGGVIDGMSVGVATGVIDGTPGAAGVSIIGGEAGASGVRVRVTTGTRVTVGVGLPGAHAVAVSATRIKANKTCFMNVSGKSNE